MRVSLTDSVQSIQLFRSRFLSHYSPDYSYSHIPGEQSKSGYAGVPQSRSSHVWVNTTVSRVDDGDTLLGQAERNLPCCSGLTWEVTLIVSLVTL